MRRIADYVPHGVIPATLLALHDDFSIDELGTRRHVRDVAASPGLSAITVNGHASEVHACMPEEQQRVLDLTLEEVGDRLPVISGVWADGSDNAARIARQAAAQGASALLVFPSQVFSMGGQLRPEMAVAHFSTIAAATDLPLIVFAYAERSTLSYPLETLVRIAEAVPSIRAIKDWSNDAMLHERQIRTLQGLSRPVNVLTTHSAWLMASLSLGCNGLLSGSGSIIPDLQVALWRAVQAGDLHRARAINDRIYPLAQAFLRRPCPRHAQPHEGMPGHAGPDGAGGRASSPGAHHGSGARAAADGFNASRYWGERSTRGGGMTPTCLRGTTASDAHERTVLPWIFPGDTDHSTRWLRRARTLSCRSR